MSNSSLTSSIPETNGPPMGDPAWVLENGTWVLYDHNDLGTLDKMTRDQVAKYYRTALIKEDLNESNWFANTNQLILAKWSHNALQYIKEKAWKGLPDPF